MNIESTLKQYHALPYLEKRVLQLRALSRVGLSKTDFLRVLNDSDLKTFLGKQFNNNILTPIFQDLNNASADGCIDFHTKLLDAWFKPTGNDIT